MEKLFFRGKGSDLPTSSNSSNAGVFQQSKGNGVTGMSVVNKSVAFSLFWVVLSIGMMWYGIGHCRSNSYNYQIKCSDSCTLIKYDPLKDEDLKLEFPKADLLRVDLVRLSEEGYVVDSAKMRLEPRVKYGHSLKLQIRLPADANGGKLKTTKDVIFTTRDMSRRPARSGSSKINSYISNTKKGVNFSSSSSVTLSGILMIIIGIISAVCAFVFGEWKDKVAPNKRTRKSS